MKLIKRLIKVGALVTTAALCLTGCANGGSSFDRTGINNIATNVDGNQSDIKSELSGNEVASNVMIVNDAQIKNKPEAGGAVIGSITAGQAIILLDKKDYSGYVKVSFNGRVGYILKNCCKLVEAEEEEQPGQEQTQAPVVVPVTPTLPVVIPTIPVKPTQAPTEPPTEAPVEQPSEEQPSEQPSEEQPSEEQPTAPTEEQPSEEQPSEEQPSQEQPSEEQPSEEQPSEEQPSEEQPTAPTEEQPIQEEPVDEEE